jgi:hypothetical protein
MLRLLHLDLGYVCDALGLHTGLRPAVHIYERKVQLFHIPV